jgi:hypothetical protein
MTTDPMHTTVCDRCYRGTWYKEPGPCHMSRPTHCPTCHQTTGEGPCGGTLRVIDRSALAPQFAHYYQTGERIRVRFAGEAEEVTGTIGRTTGWKPAYLLMRRSNVRWSPYVLSADDRVTAVKHGRTYVGTRA